jgi:hypothetical protein
LALRLLSDENVSPAVAEQLATRHRRVQIVSIQAWEEGAFRGAQDADILRAARSAGLTLVTYDLRTIGTLLKDWADAGESHAGVIYVDRRTILQSDIGGLVRALAKLWDRDSDADWVDRVAFLRP